MFTIGKSVFDGTVRRSPHRTFLEFAEQMLLRPFEVAMTRSEYLTSTSANQERAKLSAPFVVPGVYPPEGRKTDYVPVSYSLVVLDVDDSVAAAGCLKREIPWAHVLYHTVNSTDASPRLRVVIPTAVVAHADSYASVVTYLCEWFGVPVNESRELNRAFFVPTRFTSGRAETAWEPIISYDLTGPSFDTTTVAHLTSCGSQLLHSKAGPTKPPIALVDLDMARELLTHISPDIAYPEWIKVLCAVQHQFPSDDGFNLFDAWSMASPKYPGRDALVRKWNRFTVAPHGKDPITIRSVLHLCPKGKLPEATKTIEFEISRSIDMDALESIAASIPTHPFLSTMRQAELMSAVEKHALDKLGFRGTRAALRGALTVNAKAAKAQAADKSWVQEWCYLNGAWKNLKYPTLDPYKAEAFNALHARRDIGASATPHDFALKHGHIVLGTRFMPTRPDRLVTEDNELYLNMYYPPSVAPDPERAEEAGALLVNHISRMFPNPAQSTTLLDWMSWLTQNPHKQMNWCPVLQGVQGCGKSVILEIMRVTLGSTNVAEMDASRTARGWTGNLENVILVAFEEVTVGDANAAAAMKRFVTGTNLMLNVRNTGEKDVKRNFSTFITLNDLSTLSVEAGERRYWVAQAAQQRRDQNPPPSYFDQLFRLTTDLAGGILHYLRTRRVSDNFTPGGAAPVTASLLTITAVGNDSEDALTKALHAVASRVGSGLQWATAAQLTAAVSTELCATIPWATIAKHLPRVGLVRAVDDKNVWMTVGNIYGDVANNIPTK